MSRKLKALGLSLIAALAISSVAVLGASAQSGGHFSSEVSHTIIKGEQVVKNKLIDPSGLAIECNTATFEGTTSETKVSEVTITPKYEGCTTSLGGTAHIDFMECDYRFTVRSSEVETKHSTTHLVCPEGTGPVTVTATTGVGTCTISFKAQTPTGGVTYTTGGSGSTHDLLVDITASGIKVHKQAHSFFACGSFASTTEPTGAELTGTATLKGFDTAGAQVGITATGA